MRQELSAVLALALGVPIAGREFAWGAAFAIARRERCVPLAWLRGRAAIQEFAPPEVAAMWRAEALSAVSLAEFWQLLLHDSIGALHRAGVDVVVLKGLPLARRLYGELHVRPSSDLDIYVPAGQRAVADCALHERGWTRRRGEPPNEAVYGIEREGRAAFLEVHSALLDDDLVAHLSFAPPGWRNHTVGEIAVPSHDDAQLAGFLAAHLAKHSMPPLLWFIDFDTLWTALGDQEKRLARDAARRARAHRYLEWAIRRASDIRAGAAGDVNALQRLGFGDNERSEHHSALRVAALAGDPCDAARVIKAWLLPGWVRNVRQAAALSAARGAKLLRGGFKLRAAAPNLAPREGPNAQRVQRSVTLTAGDFETIVAHLAQRDAGFSIRATGRSMNPSIEPGTTVSLIPRGQRPLRVGDVVLGRTRENRCVLHRVASARAGVVETKGDANAVSDQPIPLESILAIATGIVSDGVLRPIPRSRWIRALRRARTILRATTGFPPSTGPRETSSMNSESTARVE